MLTLILPLKASSLAESEALALIQELRRLAGSHADCWRAVGVTEQALGRFAEAVEAYRQAVVHSDVSHPIGLSSRRELAQLLITLGQFSEAEPLVTESMSVSSVVSEDQLRMAQVRRSAGDRSSAEKLLSDVLKKEPENLSARLLRGTLFVELQQLAEAQADFEHCLRIAPFHDEAHYRLSQTLQRRGDPSGAAEHLQEHRRLSELKRQVLEITRRRTIAPQDPNLMDKMGDLFEALGQPSTSAEWHRSAENVRRLRSSKP